MDNSNYKETWGKIKDQTEENLKQIAMDLFNNVIFSDRHCDGDVMSCFMVLMLMGPQSPTKPSMEENDDVVENRDNITGFLIEEDDLLKKYKKEKKIYKKAYKYYQKHYLQSIGFVYEYLSDAGPGSINGKPIFMSARFLNKEDTDKMFTYYETYKQKREEVDIL